MFYGWYIVAAGVLIMAYNNGVALQGFTAFVNPIANTFIWSYAQISLAMSLRGLESGVMNPLMGMAVDRWPSKRLVLIGVIIAGLGFLSLSQVTSLAMFYISFMIVALGSSLISVVLMTTVVRWFKRDVGKASGVLAMGFGIGGLLLPVLIKIIDAYGWQTSLVILAIGMWMLGIPLSFVFRSRPEEHGLLPDGKPQDGLEGSSSSGTYDFGTGVKEALKMRAFWQMGIAWMLQIAGDSAVVLHVIPYLVSLGVERSTASIVAMSRPLASLASRLAFGWLADIFGKKYLISISMVLTSVGLFIFSLIDGSSFRLMILFAIVSGLGGGGKMSLMPPILREYFGTKNFGTIFGLTSIFSTIGMIVAPPLAGWMFDTRGVYDPIWLILSGACIIGAILMLTTPQPPRL